MAPCQVLTLTLTLTLNSNAYAWLLTLTLTLTPTATPMRGSPPRRSRTSCSSRPRSTCSRRSEPEPRPPPYTAPPTAPPTAQPSPAVAQSSGTPPRWRAAVISAASDFRIMSAVTSAEKAEQLSKTIKTRKSQLQDVVSGSREKTAQAQTRHEKYMGHVARLEEEVAAARAHAEQAAADL